MKGCDFLEVKIKSFKWFSRIFSVSLIVILLLCISVSAFAVTLDGGGVINGVIFPFFSVDTPEGYPYYVVWPNMDSRSFSVYCFNSISICEDVYISRVDEYNVKLNIPPNTDFALYEKTLESATDWQFLNYNRRTGSSELNTIYFLYGECNFTLYCDDGSVFYTPLSYDVSGVPKFPDVYLEDGWGYVCEQSGTDYRVVAFSDPSSVYVGLDETGALKYYCDGVIKRCIYSTGFVGNWHISSSGKLSVGVPVDSSFNVKFQSGQQYFPPSIPPIKQVGASLKYVLNWIGSTLTSLFSGELSGLLPLVAIPVSVALLIVAIVLIRRLIWGA